MKVIDLSPIRLTGSPIDRLKANFQGVSRFGFDWTAEMKSQEAFIGQLERLLDKRYFLLRNATLPGTETPIPIILVGPMGIYVILLTGVKGVFKAKETGWAELDKGSRKYHPARVNLITLTQQMTKLVDEYLTRLGRAHPEIQPVLFFSNPGAHIDATRPAVRILQSDGLDRLVASLLQADNVMKPEEAQLVVDALSKQMAARPEAAPKDKDAPGYDWDMPLEKQPSARFEALKGSAPAKTLQKLGFTQGQWVIILVLVVFLILILAAFLAALIVFF
jgi:hypothetical protein